MIDVCLIDLLWRKMDDYGFKTQTEFAEYIGISVAQLNYLLSGRTRCPRQYTRGMLCERLDIAPKVLDRAIIRGLNKE